MRIEGALSGTVEGVIAMMKRMMNRVVGYSVRERVVCQHM
jgi:hypothetical protein